jgi:hypothetical protein
VRKSPYYIVCISAVIGIAFCVIPPLPALGLLAAALVFPQGVHSNYFWAYFVLAMVIDFCLPAGLSFWILKRIFCRTADSKGVRKAAPKAAPDLPVKGIIYTESEIEEFKRRGLM